MNHIKFLLLVPSSSSLSSSSAHAHSSGLPLHPCLLFHNANKSPWPVSSAPVKTQTGLNSSSRPQTVSKCTLSRALTCAITAESTIFLFAAGRNVRPLFFGLFACCFFYFPSFPSPANPPQVALHACGIATDMVMEHCVQAGAAFVISPCCYGFIQNAIKFTFPKRFVHLPSGRCVTSHR